MSGAGKEEERPKLERFDGTQPSTYKKWRRKAMLMLMALPTTYTKDRWGAKLMEYLAGEAEEVCEALPIEKLVKEGGHDLVFEALDAKYKELQKDALHKHLTEYFFGTHIRAQESFRNLTVRLETAYARLKEHSVELPEEVRGWFLLRKLQLDPTAEAMVLTHTKGSLVYKEVTAAITAIFPQGVAKTGGHKSREVFEAHGDAGDEIVDPDGDEGEDVFQAVADQLQAQDEYDEEDAIEVYETYQDIRRKMQAKKMGRGYKQPPQSSSKWTLTGTVRGKIEQMKSRSRCHICNEYGHWKRECPKKKVGAATGARSSHASDAMVTDQGGDPGSYELGQELFLQEEDIDQLEIYLAEQDGRVDVVLADPNVQGDNVVTGDLEQRIFQFFKTEQDQSASSEAYMADLGIDAVPKSGVTENTEAKHCSDTMSYLNNDVPMEMQQPFVRTPLIDSLLQEVQPQLEEGPNEMSAQTLDQMSDHEEDAPDGLVQGLSGRTIFNVGKYQKMAATSFEAAYVHDKGYVAWVRKFVKGGKQETGKTTHPTMAQFRLYIALRDQRKSSRITNDTRPVAPPSVMPLQAKAKAKAKSRTAVPSSSSSQRAGYSRPTEEHEWILAANVEQPEPTPAERRRQRLLQQIEMMQHELERGIQNCKIPEERELEVSSETEVLLLEPGVELSTVAAAGLTVDSVDHMFSEGVLSASAMRSAETVQSAVEKIQQCKPLLVVIRTPEHMTCTRGSRGLCRTYTTSQRCAFTRLVAACCAEQLCEGRMFCVFEENGSLKSGVKSWSRVMSESSVEVLKIGGEGSDATVYTNCRKVKGRMTAGWPHVHRRDDERWFGKDIAVAVMERKRERHEVMVAHCVYTIDDIRVNGEDSDRKIMSVLRKCHENLGHPSAARLVMLLKSAHASERVIKLAKGLECETCSALSARKSHKVVKMRKATEFNQQVCVDTFELDVRHAKIHFLNIVDEATGFQLCTPLWKGMQAKHVRNAYRKSWKRWAGAPIRLFSDGGKEFEGEFEHGLSLDGTYGDVSAAYAPWQNGLAERSKPEVQELVDQVNNAVNSMPRVEGYSPYQHVFGRDIRIPGMITTDYDPVVNSSLVEGESVFERRMELRKAARRAFVDADSEQKIRKALEHRTRPERGPFEAGQMVYFWRKSRFESKCHWHGPAVVIGKSGQSKVWVAKGTKVYRCCPEQLRRLSPEQEATIRLLPADMVMMRHEVSARGAGNFYDLSMLDKPPESEAVERVGEIARESQRVEQVAHNLLEGLEGEEEDVGMQQAAAELPAAAVVRSDDPRSEEGAGASPTKRQRVDPEPGGITPLSQALRLDPQLLDGLPSQAASSSQLGRAPESVPVPDETDEAIQYDRKGNKHVVEHEWKKGVLSRKPNARWTGKTIFQLKPGWKWSKREDECFEVGSVKKGRKELNEHEIGKDRRSGLCQAKLKEWNKLLQSGAIVVHRGKKAQELRSTIPRRRLLKSRFVLTEAEAGSSPQTNDIKARWCIRGYLDPDLLELDTCAPTLSSEGFSVAMQLMASQGWQVTIADVEGAFLRGDDLSPSRGRLFIELPPGGIERYDETCLVEAVKTVYGLADAPKAWWTCLHGKLTGLGMRVSEFDPRVYYYYHNNKISGVIALHVDDLCMGGDKHFQQQVQVKLRELFPFKHWKTGKGEFLGKWIEQQPDGSIKISQEHYASNLKGISISQERRRQKEQELSDAERQEMRGALGGINWLVTSSRPDLAAWCSLLQQKVNTACVSDLIEVNKLVSLARDYSRSYVWIRSIPIADVQFCVLTDAAWANAAGYCSQAGYMIASCDERLAQGKWGTFSILRWKSFKQDRQTHSTLGAELLALSRGLAEARWVRSMWCEAVHSSYRLEDDAKWSHNVPITAVIDCKPVYDHARSSTVSLKDKRMAIEMLLLKKDIGKYNISLRWMATHQMIVDVLTKKGAPMNLFRKVLKEGMFVLVEDEAVKSVTFKKS
ncbi:RE1 [Symbiodinium sp. CCMP2592]|nr:RE1 [Symbiodinium sp. CCMP2592]